MKRILIITYYWPPSGGAGVQRWLKFVKYLSDFGYEVVVYTPKEGEFPSEDNSLLKDIPESVEILKTPIWEPYDLYKKFVGQKKTEKVNAGFIQESKKPKKSQGISVWIRGNLFIPDARKYWIKPSVKFLKDYLKQKPVDTIISSGPPHSMHMIALGLKRKLKTQFPNWIADFRDPWTNIDYYKDLKLSTWADKKHKRLEKRVLNEANQVITVGKTLAKELENLGAKDVVTITNGYDSDDFAEQKTSLDEKLSIAHIGSMNKDRNPIQLWKYLSEKVKTDNDFSSRLEIKLIGKVDIAVLQDLDTLELTPFLNHIKYLPHNEVVIQQQKSKVLLLVVNDTPNAKGILTGKMFEYMAAKRPILMIGPPDGDAAEILNEDGYGKCFDFGSSNFDTFFSQDFDTWKATGNPEKYTRKALTKRLSKLL